MMVIVSHHISPSQCLSLDLMVDLEEKVGHRPKLEAVAAPSLGTGKSAVGIDAIKWWQQGNWPSPVA